MFSSNRHTQLHRSLRDTRLAFSNLVYLFNPGSNIVITWYEILAGLCILSLLSFLVSMVFYFALLSGRKEPPFSAALCNKSAFHKQSFS
jgi:hypothetical protein